MHMQAITGSMLYVQSMCRPALKHQSRFPLPVVVTNNYIHVNLKRGGSGISTFTQYKLPPHKVLTS